jgi:hypothetical protein
VERESDLGDDMGFDMPERYRYLRCILLLAYSVEPTTHLESIALIVMKNADGRLETTTGILDPMRKGRQRCPRTGLYTVTPTVGPNT